MYTTTNLLSAERCGPGKNFFAQIQELLDLSGELLILGHLWPLLKLAENIQNTGAHIYAQTVQIDRSMIELHPHDTWYSDCSVEWALDET